MSPLFLLAQVEWSGIGTSFAIHEEGYLVTNNHVISRDGQEAGFILIGITREEKNYTIPAEIITTDAENDLAILKISEEFDLGAIPYTFSKVEAEVGTSIFNLGYPRVGIQGWEVKLNDGIINSVSGFQGNKTQYQTNLSVYPGNSGGPVIDRDGKVIGVINSKWYDGVGEAGNVSWAIKTHLLDDLAASENISLSYEKSVIEGLDLTKQTKQVRDFVFVVFAFDSEATFNEYLNELEEGEALETPSDDSQVDVGNEPTVPTAPPQPVATLNFDNINQNFEQILAQFAHEEVNIVVLGTESNQEIDRFTVIRYLKRLKLLKRYEPTVIDKEVDGNGKITKLFVKETEINK